MSTKTTPPPPTPARGGGVVVGEGGGWFPSWSRFSRYKTRDAVIYYALVLPAIVSEMLFSIAIASAPGVFVPPTDPYAGLVGTVARLLPLLVLFASFYAVFAFRPSILVTLLTVSFFLAVSVTGPVAVLGAQLSLLAMVMLVIVPAFLALMGFNYARGLRLLGDGTPDANTSGPFGYNALGLTIEVVAPLAAALVLVLLVSAVVAALTAQSNLLPAPLSTLASLYLQSRIGLVFTTLFVAGAAIWVMRQFVEPLVLYFTLSAADARKELLWEIEPTMKTTRRVASYRPSGGLAWGFLAVAYCLGIILALAFYSPRGEFLRGLAGVLTLHAPKPTAIEDVLQNAFQNGITKANIYFAQLEQLIRDTIQLLWG